jgi:uncharacterized OsmC-like protein
LAELTKNCLINCLVQEQFYTWRIESKIKEDAESQFAAQADQNYCDVTDFLIESTKFDYQLFLKNGYKQ